LTIDEVFANSLSDVGSADSVADRIASIEKQKDGNFTTEVMFAKDIPAGDVQTYLIEYRCDTSRGAKMMMELMMELLKRYERMVANLRARCFQSRIGN